MMRIAFMGSPEFAALTLQGLLDANVTVTSICTMPPRPAHRGQQIRSTPVAKIAEKYDLPIYTPEKLDEAVLQQILSTKPDMLVVVAYGLKLPANFLTSCKFGAVNIHASLLPRFRGASPIQSAILAGDQHSGISLMQMDEGMDSGMILAQNSLNITADMTASALHDDLQILGQKMMLQLIADYDAGKNITPVPQDEAKVSFARKITRQDGKIDFSTMTAEHIMRMLRAFTPWPGVWFNYQGNRLMIHQASILSSSSSKHCGEITSISDGIHIICKDSAIKITQIQRVGGKILPWDAFLRGFPMCIGTACS